jgi:DNA-binding NarL/FixJ family response regulator
MSRVLVVEDNPTFRQSLRDILHLRFPSIEIAEAADGKEAFQNIRSCLPDLIFMDIKLPGENGLSLTKRIKTEHPEVVIIILTSYDLPEYREAASRSQANHFLSKDSSANEIFTLVESTLSESGQASERPQGKP